MKTNLFALLSLVTASLFSSCYQGIDESLPTSVDVTFNLSQQGILQEPMTRAGITAPGNLIVFDSFNGGVTSTTHTSASSVSLPLALGTHDLYFVAADKLWASASNKDLTVTWNNSGNRLSYTWAKHITLDVEVGTNPATVQMPLVVGAVQVVTLDYFPAAAATLSVEAPNVSWVLDVATMKGKATTQEGGYSINCSGLAGKSRLTHNIFTFIPSSSNVGDIAITVADSKNGELANQILNSVPVQEGYVSRYQGYFFSDGLTIPFEYSDDWTGTIDYTF